MKLFRPPGAVKWIYHRRTWGFSFAENGIYLTFDDGPHPDITPFVLDELLKRNIKACFFCVGENVVRYPEIYQRILAEGHRVGNHTMRHENAFKTSVHQYLESVREASKLINSPYFRPPYGRLSPRLARVLSQEYKIIMWSWLSYDFDLSISNEFILNQARKIKQGDVLVLHDNPKIASRQKQLLPALLDQLQQSDLKFLTLP